MRTRQGVELSLKPVDMHGGGYAHFLDELRTYGQTNCLARFILIDGDRLRDDAGEWHNFTELLDYCRRENAKKAVPCLLIVNSPDFEYIACAHDPAFSGQSVNHFITSGLGFKSIAAFKGKADIYDFLNTGNRNYHVMLGKMKTGQVVVENQYQIKRQTFEIHVRKTSFKEENVGKRGSNIAEFFDVIDWK